jgi:hypothetical protein
LGSDETPRYIAPGSRGRVLGVDPTTGRGAGRDEYREDIEKMVEEIVNEKVAEMYGRLEQLVRENFERFAEEYLNKSGVDERRIRSIAKAIAASEALRIVMAEMDKFRAEVEEKLSKYGIDAETIRRIVDEIYGRLLSELDKRFMHVLDAMNEVGNMNRDVLDLVSEILRHESTFEEELGKLKSALDEERLEEIFYRMLVKRGILKKKRRKWGWVAVGLGILAAIVVGLVVNPIITLVILFITFVILMRW